MSKTNDADRELNPNLRGTKYTNQNLIGNQNIHNKYYFWFLTKMMYEEKVSTCISLNQNQNVKVTKKSSEFDTHNLLFYDIFFF